MSMNDPRSRAPCIECEERAAVQGEEYCPDCRDNLAEAAQERQMEAVYGGGGAGDHGRDAPRRVGREAEAAMRPQPKKARDALIEALEALQDPKALCKQRGHSEDHAYAYAAGVAKSCIEHSLHALGEPIELYRPFGVPYHRAGSDSQL